MADTISKLTYETIHERLKKCESVDAVLDVFLEADRRTYSARHSDGSVRPTGRYKGILGRNITNRNNHGKMRRNGEFVGLYNQRSLKPLFEEVLERLCNDIFMKHSTKRGFLNHVDKYGRPRLLRVVLDYAVADDGIRFNFYNIPIRVRGYGLSFFP